MKKLASWPTSVMDTKHYRQRNGEPIDKGLDQMATWKLRIYHGNWLTLHHLMSTIMSKLSRKIQKSGSTRLSQDDSLANHKAVLRWPDLLVRTSTRGRVLILHIDLINSKIYPNEISGKNSQQTPQITRTNPTRTENP